MEGLSIRERHAFELTRAAAASVLKRRLRLLKLVFDAYRKFGQNEPALSRVRGDLLQLFRLAHAWARREYTLLPWRSILYAVAAIVYFVNPIDIIPDAILGLGFIDDISVVGAVARAIRRDLVDFQEWESGSVTHRLPRRFRAAA